MGKITMIDVVIFDVDGTIADNSSRTHYITGGKQDWESYNKETYADKPMQAMLNQLDIIGLISPIILLTGRVNSTRGVTIQWLRDHGISYNITANPKKMSRKSIYLIMRNDGDRTPNDQYKKKEVYRLKANFINPILAFDDDDKCRKMFRDFHIDVINPEVIMKQKGV